MNIVNLIKEKLQNFLEITNRENINFQIDTKITHDTMCNIEEVMYRSEPYELHQFFSNLDLENGMFYAVRSKKKIRRVSTHLFPDIIDRHSDILVGGYNSIEFKDKEDEDRFNEVFTNEKGQNFTELLKKLDTYCMLYGDVCLKLTIDTAVTNTPIIEIVKSNRFEPIFKRNILEKVIFYTDYVVNKKKYLLNEEYGKGYIKYTLYDAEGREVNMECVPELAGVTDIQFNADYMMCSVVKYWDSLRFEHRGEPLISNIDCFDVLDEIESLWPMGLRRSQPLRMVNKNAVAKDDNGNMLGVDDYSMDCVMQGSIMDADAAPMAMIQPSFDINNYESSRIYFMEECLRDGKISPVSMAIDKNKYDDNYSADKQKERLTRWTRNQRVDKLVEIIPDFIDKVLKTYENITQSIIKEHECEIKFDDFSSPDVEEVIDTLNKACPGMQLLSRKSMVDMMGDALGKDDKWKSEEVMMLDEEDSTSMEDTEYFPNIPSDDINQNRTGAESA